jgi:RNA polymerase sigma-70 factor (ECF subfamily)
VDNSAISPEEVFLTCLRSGDESAWAEFLRRFQPLILRTIIKVSTHWGDRSPQTVDELLQETYLKLCSDRESILKSFRPTHPDSVYGYLKVFAANLAQDHFKAASATKRGGSIRIESAGNRSTEIANAMEMRSHHDRIERTVLLQEIESILNGLVAGPNADRDRLIFWLYYRSGLAANSIASIPSIDLTTKGVESTLQRMTTQLRNHLCPSAVSTLRNLPEDKGNVAGDSL